VPELPANKRAAGSYVSAYYNPPPRAYPGDQLGGLCEACKTPIPAALAGLETTHATCDPDWPPMLAAFKREMARRKVQA
jgi:hypothetical protein